MPAIEVTIFNVLRDVLSSGEVSPTRAGHVFEDRVSQATFSELSAQGVSVYPPRYMLQALPTISGLRHQFDVVASTGSIHYLVECKRRQNTTLDQLFGFVGKVLDYVLAGLPRKLEYKAYFASAGAQIHDNHRRYALSFGIIPLSEDLPPPVALAGRAASDRPELRQLITTFEQSTSETIHKYFRGEAQPSAEELLMRWKGILNEARQ